MAAREHRARIGEIKPALRDRGGAFSRIEGDPHAFNVATKNVRFKALSKGLGMEQGWRVRTRPYQPMPPAGEGADMTETSHPAAPRAILKEADMRRALDRAAALVAWGASYQRAIAGGSARLRARRPEPASRR